MNSDFLKYYLRNKAKIVLLLGVIIIGILGTLIITSIFGSFGDTKIKIFQYARDWTTITTFDNTVLASVDLDNIKSNDLTYIIDSNILPLYYPFMGVANASIILHGVNSIDLEFLKTRYELQLIKGEWFKEGSNQIVVTDSFLKARNLKVGDRVGREVAMEDNDAPGSFEIVGVITGKQWFILGSKDYISNVSDYKRYLVFPFEQVTLNVKKILENAKNISIQTPEMAKEQMMRYNREYYLIYFGISLFFAVIVGIGAGFLTIIFYNGRTVEFAIKNLMGYSKQRILGDIILEQAILWGLGWIIAIILGYFTMNILKINYFASEGLVLTIKLITLIGTSIIPIIGLLFLAYYFGRKFKIEELYEPIIGKK